VTVLLVLAAATVVGLDASGHLPGGILGEAAPSPSPSPSPSPKPSPAGPVLTPVTASAGGPAAFDERLLSDPDLGGDPGAYVVDAVTGEVLLDRSGAEPRTPASVSKLATAAAALMVLEPDLRLVTRTVTGAQPGEVVLVGGGDTTLTFRPPKAAAYPQPASLTALADATAAALRTQATDRVTVRVDDSLFSGPAVSPDWRPSYVASGVVSRVSALSVDAGRVRPGFSKRVQDPALEAGRRLARLLAARGLSVAPEVTRQVPAPAASALAAVSSPELPSLVETMLSTSDNDLAESLARLAAAARGEPASFAGISSVLPDVITELGVPTGGLELLDGSGLARASTIAPETLGQLLAVAARGEQPRLRPLVTGLPVASFTGTLADRFGATGPRAGAGLVRAKTGTLTGVASLAGIATQPGVAGDRLLAFALLTDDVAPTDALTARDALDLIAAAFTRPDG